MNRRLVVLGVLAAAAALVVLVPLQQAPAGPLCDVSWTGAASGDDWDNPGNWDTHSVPGSSDAVCIDRPGAAVVLLSQSSVKSLCRRS